ncbi:hypothetical protein KHA93_16495 [Bacillus sp. FJAT-49732]|uniref:Uncharacterized protein n=1 Tax=Lederbergia citrisecunda TaxID=2833583 RepID=A0A942TPM9_9BACI|nr:hypothetical protein [Lederbergia citrisecunda]MBS4201238.1 hypothetical protein [Lederbergia citrisecunda]
MSKIDLIIKMFLDELREELKKATGYIENDNANGSIYSIRKIASAINTLEKYKTITMTFKFAENTWQVFYKNKELQFNGYLREAIVEQKIKKGEHRLKNS